MLAVLLGLGVLAAALLPASEPTGEAEPRDNLGFCGGVMELLVRFVVQVHNRVQSRIALIVP